MNAPKGGWWLMERKIKKINKENMHTNERTMFEEWCKSNRPFDDVRFVGVGAWIAWQERAKIGAARIQYLLDQLEQKEAARVTLASALETVSVKLKQLEDSKTNA